MAYAGMLAGVWYGCLARVGRMLDAGAWLGAFIDVLIAAGVGAIVCVGLLVANYGEIRFYALLGALMGFALYRITIGRLVCFLFDWLALRLMRCVRWVGKWDFIKKIFR